MTIDRFDTPPELAAVLASSLTTTPSTVVDFAAGSGNLLRAAANAHGCEVFAADIDSRVVRALRREASWSVSKMDFLDPRSRIRASILQEAPFDAAILNPPFSQRGAASLISSEVGERKVTASKGVAFLLEALNYVSPRGEISIVLPEGAMTNNRDREAWALVRSMGKLSTVQRWPRGHFPKCTANLVVLHIKRVERAKLRIANEAAAPDVDSGPWFKRGTHPVHAAIGDESGIPFVHTTQLDAGSFNPSLLIKSPRTSVVAGPFVTIARVGKPDIEKVAVVPGGTHALSDCVFAISCVSIEAAQLAAQCIRANWASLMSLYSGTCARHLTKGRLQALLVELGVKDISLGTESGAIVDGQTATSPIRVAAAT